MAFHKRAPSIDMTSIELRNSPAPTYSSTCETQDWPLTPQHASFSSTAKSSTSNNPYYQSIVTDPVPLPFEPTGKQPREDAGDSPAKPDYHDPNHPHYVKPSAKFEAQSLPPLPPRRRWPQKRVLIPWILAILFFLITLWFTSVALGARFFSILHPLPSNPTVQEIHVIVDGQNLQGAISITTITETRTSSSSSISSVLGATSTDGSDANLPVTTGRLQLVPTGQPSLEDIDGRLERRSSGFVTVTRGTV